MQCPGTINAWTSGQMFAPGPVFLGIRELSNYKLLIFEFEFMLLMITETATCYYLMYLSYAIFTLNLLLCNAQIISLLFLFPHSCKTFLLLFFTSSRPKIWETGTISMNESVWKGRAKSMPHVFHRSENKEPYWNCDEHRRDANTPSLVHSTRQCLHKWVFHQEPKFFMLGQFLLSK